jgi:hypothetical protein
MAKETVPNRRYTDALGVAAGGVGGLGTAARIIVSGAAHGGTAAATTNRRGAMEPWQAERPRFAARCVRSSCKPNGSDNNALLGAFIETQCGSAALAFHRTAAVR